MDTDSRLVLAEQNVKTLEARVSRLEEEMALCLRWMRMQAEAEVKRRHPLYSSKDNAKA